MQTVRFQNQPVHDIWSTCLPFTELRPIQIEYAMCLFTRKGGEFCQGVTQNRGLIANENRAVCNDSGLARSSSLCVTHWIVCQGIEPDGTRWQSAASDVAAPLAPGRQGGVLPVCPVAELATREGGEGGVQKQESVLLGRSSSIHESVPRTNRACNVSEHANGRTHAGYVIQSAKCLTSPETFISL